MAAFNLGTLSDNGNSTAIRLPGAKFTWNAQGNFGGGTAKLQIQVDGSNWDDVTDATLTANGQKVIDLGSVQPDHNYQIRVNLAGATTPSLVNEIL